MNDKIQLISSPITLPNGVTVPNRLVKAAMAEGLGWSGGPPTPAHSRLYHQWAQGGWCMIISGNVQVDPRHLASPFDLGISTKARDRQAFTDLVVNSRALRNRPLMIMQLSHPGLQSSSTLGLSRRPWERAMAPCSARPDVGNGVLGWLYSRIIWPRKSRKVILVEEWLKIIARFLQGAVMAAETGWDGVQIHSAHGYLLAEYLSPLTNPDPRPLPGVPEDVPLRLHLLYLILKGVDESTPDYFIKAVKINCSDFVQGGLDEIQASEIVKSIASWSLVDIIEISGGNYSQPAFASPETISHSSPSPSKRQSLFAHFTTSLLPSLPPPPTGPAILLTGGLHDRELIASSLQERACDLVGIGRPACLIPDLPSKIILNPDIADKDTSLGDYSIPQIDIVKAILGGSNKAGSGIPLVGAGVSTLWHTWQMCRMGRGELPDESMSWLRGLFVEGIWKGFVG